MTKANWAAQAFDDLADRYDAWYDTASGRVLFDLELGALRPLLAGTAGPRLEVGVGSGRFAAALGIEVGLDPVEAPLRLARARGVRVLRGVGSQLPFADSTFGAVALIVTLCFVENPAGVLAEVGRVLRPGGRLVVGLVPLDSGWGRLYQEKGRTGHPFYSHARFQTLAEHRLMLALAGFRLVGARSTLFQAPNDQPVAEPVREDTVSGAGFVALAAQRESAGTD
ncbi:MAG: methyltransferase domain-containing protein [Actinomycetota bacterium]|nr:methyltransferase domain-containing protein [Actinomycetota bacterium]